MFVKYKMLEAFSANLKLNMFLLIISLFFT